jgi:hypothetical protein
MRFGQSEPSGREFIMTLAAGDTRADSGQKVGGIAAFYLAFALIAAIPYFLVLVDYPSADTSAARVDLIIDNYPSMYAVYLVTYVLFGIAVGVLALAVYDRLRTVALSTARIATIVGLTWSFVLVASGLIFTYGMTTIHDMAATDPTQAALTWQSVEPVALALGGAGGELLGGLWVLLIGGLTVKSGTMPKGLGWLGIVIGVIGLISVVPQLHDATVAFGLLEIAWLAWLGWVLLTTKPVSGADVSLPVAGDLDVSATGAPR